MTYSLNSPPCALVFGKASKRDLAAYASWFNDSLEPRISLLAAEVASTSGQECWRPDLTPDSFGSLGRWFEGQVSTRPRTESELAELRASLAFPVDVAKVELTDRTFSLAIDVGMYLGQAVIARVPGARWEQALKNRKSADYGHVVVVGSGAVPLNPSRFV